MKLEFESIIFDENRGVINYPTKETEFILVTNDDMFIHCISIYSMEDTCSGQEEMLICVPKDESYNYDICFFNCKYIAYLE